MYNNDTHYVTLNLELRRINFIRLNLTIATPYLLVSFSILLRGFKEFKMQQPDLTTPPERSLVACQ